jgi:hypothetical protein
MLLEKNVRQNEERSVEKDMAYPVRSERPHEQALM